MNKELTGYEHPDEFTRASEVIEQIEVPGYHAIDLQIYLLLSETPFENVYTGLLNSHYKEILNSDSLPTNEPELAEVFFNELLLYSIRKYLGILDSPKGEEFVLDDENFNILYDLKFHYTQYFTEDLNTYLIAFAKDFRDLLQTYTSQKLECISTNINEDLQKAYDFQQRITKYIASEFETNPVVKDRAIKMLKTSYKRTAFEKVMPSKLVREVEFWRKFIQGSLEEEDIQDELNIRRSTGTSMSSE